MTQRYEIAAWRHLKVGEQLLRVNEIDDAGYHFGVSGENAVKAMLQNSGVESHWNSQGVGPRETPMQYHFPRLHQMVADTSAEIQLYAQGRLAGHIASQITHISFSQRFAGWNINIRYADTDHTPVTQASAQQWHTDAEQLAEALIT